MFYINEEFRIKSLSYEERISALNCDTVRVNQTSLEMLSETVRKNVSEVEKVTLV